MINKDNELLFQDLSARLQYGVKARVFGWDEEKGEIEVALKIYSINTDGYVYFETNDYDINYLLIEDVRPYLRPMSSMTEEEEQEYRSLRGMQFADELADANTTIYYFDTIESFDWLNKKMFDYRGLIPKNQAISTEIFNP